MVKKFLAVLAVAGGVLVAAPATSYAYINQANAEDVCHNHTYQTSNWAIHGATGYYISVGPVNYAIFQNPGAAPVPTQMYAPNRINDNRIAVSVAYGTHMTSPMAGVENRCIVTGTNNSNAYVESYGQYWRTFEYR